MIDFITKSVNTRTITAFFDTREAAEKATEGLVSLGVARHQILMTEGDSEAAATETTPHADMGFWESLKSIFLPDEDRHSYAEGLRRGGYLLSVETDETLYDRALEVVDSDGAVDMDEREANWRAAGWQGHQADPGVATGGALGAAAGMASEPALITPVPAQSEGISGYDSLRVGTRDTSHGRQRLRSYTMDPVADPSAALREDPSKGIFGMSERFSPATDAKLIGEHMDVIDSEGIKIGTVDHLDGDNIKLTKSASPDGLHHFIPLTSIDHVDEHVHLNKSASEIRAVW